MVISLETAVHLTFGNDDFLNFYSGSSLFCHSGHHDVRLPELPHPCCNAVSYLFQHVLRRLSTVINCPTPLCEPEQVVVAIQEECCRTKR